MYLLNIEAPEHRLRFGVKTLFESALQSKMVLYRPVRDPDF
jgi:hypothetical protein